MLKMSESSEQKSDDEYQNSAAETAIVGASPRTSDGGLAVAASADDKQPRQNEDIESSDSVQVAIPPPGENLFVRENPW